MVLLLSLVVVGWNQAAQTSRDRQAQLVLQGRARLSLDRLTREAREAAFIYPEGFVLQAPPLKVGPEVLALIRPEFDAAGLPVPDRYRLLVAYLSPAGAGGDRQLVLQQTRQFSWRPTRQSGRIRNWPQRIDEQRTVLAENAAVWRVQRDAAAGLGLQLSLTLTQGGQRVALETAAFARSFQP